jgi:hypothetical protein
MKKGMMILAVTTLFAAGGVKNSNAQTTIDFEDLTLPGADTYWNGSDESGGFTSGVAFFSNYYNTAWGSWSGFAYSNHTDNTTPGFGNQYSSYPGEGFFGSSNYAVFYSGGTVMFNQNQQSVELAGVYVTNSTYTALDMRDGSPFSKQFGSPNGPDGNPDGTNGEDWFLLTIYGLDENGDTTGNVEYYLADYRFPDNNDDYIVDTWKWVDLTSLGAVYGLTFGLTSSDIGQWGMNTPAYFTLDNIEIQGFTGLPAFTVQDVKVFPNPVTDYVEINSTHTINQIRVVDLTGREIMNRIGEGATNKIITTKDWPSGVYLVQLSSGNDMITKKLIKE